MSKTKILIFIMSFIFLVILVAAQNYVIDWNQVPTNPSTTDTQQRSFGTCTCNKVVGQCDVNCCCDKECSSSFYTTAFTKCVSSVNKKDYNYACVANSLVTFSNLQSGINVEEATNPAATPFFCVYYEASSVQGNFFTQIDDLELDSIKKAVDNEDRSEKYKRLTPLSKIYGQTPSATNTNPNHYVYGDHIKTSSNFFSVAYPANSLLCELTSYVKYLQNKPSSTCQMTFSTSSSLFSACGDVLSLSTINSLKVSRVGSPSLSSDYFLVSFGTLTLVNSDGSETSLSLPISTVFDNTLNICRFAVIGTKYYITFEEDSTISSVTVDLRFKHVSVGTVERSAEVLFINSTSTEWKDGTIRPNSGNPGYKRAMPVLAGKLTTNAAKSAILQNINGIEIKTGLSCSSTSQITFDVDQDIGCSTSLSLSELKSLCTTNTISELSFDYTHVGRFGNADFHNVNDWVKITSESKPSATWDDLTNTCNNLAAGVEYQFVIAKAGSVYNEQWKIAGVRRMYYPLKWKFTNKDPTSKQLFWIENRIRFIRISNQPLVQKNYPAPTLLPFLPEDVFYPFSLLSSSSPQNSQ
ncbi:hypothetical protein ABK040_008426 [Willaertia magna]